jgi:hypothetical protein
MYEHLTPKDDIDWEQIFQRITGSEKAPVSHLMLSRRIENTHSLDSDEAWQAVYKASERGELLQVIVERFPDVHRKYYFLPRIPFEDAGRIYIPFWNYMLEEVVQGDGWFICSDLYDRVRERDVGEISECDLNAVDEHLEAITPVYTSKRSMKGTKVRSDTMRLYQNLSKVSGATNTDVSDFDTDTISI